MGRHDEPPGEGLEIWRDLGRSGEIWRDMTSRGGLERAPRGALRRLRLALTRTRTLTPAGGLREGSEPLPSGLADCPLRGPRRGRERHRLLQRHPRHRAAERRDGRRLAALAVEGDLGRA